MSQSFRLMWDDFQENSCLAFGGLREDKDFSDVTLVCDGVQQLDTHKIVLAAASPFFEKILKRNKHEHPLIYLKGVNLDDLQAVMDFIYYGETNVAQDNVDSFFGLAKELMIKGLMSSEVKGGTTSKPELDLKPNIGAQTDFIEDSMNEKLVTPNVAGFQTIDDWTHPMEEPSELDKKLNSMMTKTDHRLSGTEVRTAFLCTECGLEGTRRNVRKHIEAKHVETEPLLCDQCEKTCKTRSALKEHKMKYHTAKDQ